MTRPEILFDGLVMGESPRWHDGRLWVADWGAQEVLAIDLDGNREVVARVASLPLSVDWNPDGQMLLISSADRALLTRQPDGTLAVHTDLRSIADTPWNEIVVDGRGNIFLNNIGFDFPAGQVRPGFIAGIPAEGGPLRRLADGVEFPNGMAVTPDNATLIVAESYGHRLTAFDIDDAGELHGRRVWADLGDAAPDGICLDADNAVWYADVPHRRCVRVAAGGRALQTVDVDRGCFACMLGGPDGSTLFIVAARWPDVMDPQAPRSGQVLTVAAPAPAAGFP